jgi:hypothetical protein
MEKKFLAELYQLDSISYLSPVDHYFRFFLPTDFLKGAIIYANSIPSGLQDLVSPYSVEEFKNTFKKAGRSDVFNGKFLEMKPCGETTRFSKEFVGVVKSMSSRGETTRQKIRIIYAGDPLRVNHTCTCDKRFNNWDVRAVWHRIILDEWRIPEPHVKYYRISTCPHVCAGDFYVRDNFSVRIFGIEDGFDLEEDGKIVPFLKPYILAYKEALDCTPTFPDYIFDTILTHHTRFFDGIKKYIDSMRKEQGMKPLDLHGIGDYLVDNFIHSGYPEDRINELIWIFAGL